MNVSKRRQEFAEFTAAKLTAFTAISIRPETLYGLDEELLKIISDVVKEASHCTRCGRKNENVCVGCQ